ncbi:ARM repeat-containing protein [Durotheca rogersii]|uniref:ARM repeat-containing protein n=1 Tax=Durotheca rogersii TaxID=419775 RepID=UPI002220812D|nr:ARM repeat-containing protein [Durotheca rogersii]KAI5864741.1 ARM repeat-containing protein [Durotheca rogersii]
MDFAIEVPGAATPLSFPELCRALESASSHDTNRRQSATQQLEAWESSPDYYPTLHAAFLDKSLPRDVRLLAIIQLKNGINKRWRHSFDASKPTIPPAGKQAIRERLFQGTIGEEDRQLAMQNTLVVAKLVRIDYPNAWSDPLTKIIAIIRATKDGNQAELSGALKILLHIVKELGTARLRKSQTALQYVTPELVYLLAEIYDAKTSEWIASLSHGGEGGDRVLLAMENSHEALKTLRRLLLLGYENPHQDDTVRRVWGLTQMHFAQFLAFVDSDAPNVAPYADIIGKHLLKFAKLHIEMAREYPASFASLPNSLDLVRAYWDLVAKFAQIFNNSSGIRQENLAGESKSKTEGPLVERLALQGLLLVRACIKLVHQPKQTIRYRPQDSLQEQRDAIATVKANVFTDDFVTQMANVIISHFFAFRQADLDAWNEEPQEWEQQEETQGNAYEWEVRPCAERLFLDLVIHHSDLLVEPLLSYFSLARGPQADLAIKEAVYTAMGLAAPIVCDKVDFGEMVRTTIAADAQQAGQWCQILRRRIAILLSQWVPVKMDNKTRPLVYEIFRHFLNSRDGCNDIVVRITAARQLKSVVDEIEFQEALFVPFAADIFTELIGLLQQVDIDETKLAILETTRCLVQRMDTQVHHLSDMVMDTLPAIWQSAGDQNTMLKQSVLAIMQALVVSLKTEWQRYHVRIVPLIIEATQENTEIYLYLIDEVLELWRSALTQTTPPLPSDLLHLARIAIRGLELQNEHVSEYVELVGDYIVLAPEALLEDQLREPTLSSLAGCLRSGSRDLVKAAAANASIYLQLSHKLGGVTGLQVVVRDMMKTGLLPHIFEVLHTHHEASIDGDDRRIVQTPVLCDYFEVLSHIAVLDPGTFAELLTSLDPPDRVWDWLSAEWLLIATRYTADISNKLTLLALTRLLEPQVMQDLVLQKMREYFKMWVFVMSEILDNDDHPGSDLLVYAGEPERQDWDTVKDERLKILEWYSPARTTQSLAFVRERLQGLVQRVGGEEVFRANWGARIGDDWDKFQQLDVHWRQRTTGGGS